MKKFLNSLGDIFLVIFKGFALIVVSPIIIFIGLLHFFDRIQKKIFGSKDIRIDDSVFGKMLFVSFDEDSYWETESIFFEPTNSQISFLVHAGEKGPTKKQKDFFKDIEKNYLRHFEEIWYPFLKTEVDIWFAERELLENDIKDSFVPESMTIPRFRGKNYKWEITFTTKLDAHYFTVEMKGWKPTGLQIDG